MCVMTLVLTRAANDHVIEVADRLLTQHGGAQFDTISKKNVLFEARKWRRDARAPRICNLGGVPTDQWIVETLTGFTFDRNGRPPAFVSSRPGNPRTAERPATSKVA